MRSTWPWLTVIGAVLIALATALAQVSRDPGGVSYSSAVKLSVLTVATLPACTATLQGRMAAVSDATTPTYNAALVGGGAVIVPVFCNGTAWSSH